MDDESALRRQRRNEQNSAYAKELEAQISNNKRRRDREKLEQEARDRREEEQVARERAQPVRRGGGGEPIRNADGNVVTQLHLLKDANGDMVPPTGGELLERTKLQVPPQPRGRDLIERTKPGAFDQRFGVTGGGGGGGYGGGGGGGYGGVATTGGGGGEPTVGYTGGGGLSAMYADGMDNARRESNLRYQQELQQQITDGQNRKARDKARRPDEVRRGPGRACQPQC